MAHNFLVVWQENKYQRDRWCAFPRGHWGADSGLRESADGGGSQLLATISFGPCGFSFFSEGPVPGEVMGQLVVTPGEKMTACVEGAGGCYELFF